MKARELRGKKKEELLKQLDDLKQVNNLDMRENKLDMNGVLHW